jgi:hypothetical protein
VVGSVVTLELYRPHDVEVGDQLMIQGVRGAAGASYNGYYLCSAVPDNTHFSYVASSPPGGPNPVADIRWARKWGVKRTIFEDNTIVLDDNDTVPAAIQVGSYPFSLVPNFKVYDQVVIRRNHISKLNPTSGKRAIGISCDQVANLIVEDNVIDLPDIVAWDSLTVITNTRCFSRNNKKPNGTSIRPYDWNVGKYLNDVDRTIEGGNLLSVAGL